ncbi:hemagglutinin, partial [Ralstonia pickettii]|nr:hemagglutinin [Ralstonia pickettii]
SALATKVDTSVLNVNQSSAGYAAASAVNTYDIALGRGSVANGSPSGGALNPAIAIGLSANAVGSYTTAMGYSSNARGSSSMALGAFSNASGDGSVALGNGSQATRNNTVSVGNATTNRQITNVAAGTQSTDAVNVGQLSGVTKALGGGAAVDGSGNVTQPTYKVAGTDYHNVGDALDALAASGGTDPNAVTYDGATKD